MSFSGRSSSSDPLGTLQRESAREEEREFDRAAAAQEAAAIEAFERSAAHFRAHVSQSPTRGFDAQHEQSQQLQQSQSQPPSRPAAFTDYRTTTFHEYRSEFTHPLASSSSSASAAGARFPNAELRALSESMRSLSVPPAGVGGEARSTTAERPADFCDICDQEEQSMSSTQRRHHEHHQGRQQQPSPQYQQPLYYQPPPSQPTPQPQQRPYEQPRPYDALSSFAQPASSNSSFHPSPSPLSVPFAPLPASASIGVGSGAAGDESLLYSSQPSRAVLSALRSLQDKLQELRVEKAGTENRLARLEQDAAAREHELIKKHDRALADAQAKLADAEATHLGRLKDAREAGEKLSVSNLKLESEVRMLRDNLSTRDADLKSLRDESHQMKLRVNDAELALARAVNDRSSGERAAEVERATLAERDLEVTRLKNEVNTLAEQLHQANQQHQQLRMQMAAVEDARDRAEQSHSDAQASTHRLAADLQVVQQDLLRERDAKQALLNYKYLTRDYVSSLLNLNYELCIDAGMSVRKRSDLLKHSQDLLQGLKKHAWSIDDELPKEVIEATQAERHGGYESASGASSVAPSSPFRGTSPPRRVTINGVHTRIEEQKYLLAGASSPEAIRVLHPDTRDTESESESEPEEEYLPVRLRVPTTPTVASTNKQQPLRRRPSAAPTKGSQHCHTLQQRDLPLPFTVGRSTKQSFSVPVNVQEILSKQPSYYTKVAQKQLAQTRRRASGGAAQHVGTVEEERIIVFPPPPSSSISAASSVDGHSDTESPSPVSLAAHSVGLSTVIAHLESEVETLNRDYIFHLDHSRRDGESDKQQLQKRLQTILKQIEKKTKQVELLKQHQESVLGNHGVRLYSASTAASRSSRSSSQKQPATSRASSSARRASVTRPSTATAAVMRKAPSVKKRVVVSSSSTDLADRHAHHQHGAQAATPMRPRYDADASIGLPQHGFLSPNSQRLLEKKIKSMRLLGQFREMFDGEDGDGDAARRFGSD